jgi:hypothetical protein
MTWRVYEIVKVVSPVLNHAKNGKGSRNEIMDNSKRDVLSGRSMWDIVSRQS